MTIKNNKLQVRGGKKTHNRKMSHSLNNNDQAPFWLEDWYVEPSISCITRDGEKTKLEPKVMTVLVCLANEQGKVMSREALEALAWPGSIVGYDALASTIIKLRKAFADDSKNSRIIQTVPKKGYRLIGEVRPVDDPPHLSPLHTTADTDDTGESNAEHINTAVDKRKSSKRLVEAFGLSIVLVSVVIYFTNFSDNQSQSFQTEKPSIAVLPFKNISNDEQQEYFSDGITTDLITDLSKISSIWVIARNTVFTYKNTNVDVRDVGKELNVDYVVEGSVRKVDENVRISARLINTRNGFNLWAERFDGDMGNVFALQDDVTAKIVSALELKLTEQERKRISQKYTNSIDAYDNFLQGWQKYWEFSRESNLLAREFFTKAIEQDDRFARAYANLALTYSNEVFSSWTNDYKASIGMARNFAAKALELDDSLPQVHWAVGFTALVERDYQLSMQEAQKTIELDPNYADGYGLLATTLNFAGRPKDALENIQKAMRLNPRYTNPYMMIVGQIYFNLHDYERAIDNFNRALERNPVSQQVRLWLAASYAHNEKLDSAKWEIEQIRIADPEISIEKVEKLTPLKDVAQLNHFIEGLRKSGLK